MHQRRAIWFKIVSKDRKEIIEKIAYIILIIGLSVAGYLYETYKHSIPEIILVPLIIAYMLLLFFVYKLALRITSKVKNP